MNVPKTIEEARLACAPLWKKAFEEIKAQKLSAGQPALKTNASRDIESFACGCYSLPWLRKEMTAWMIDFCWGAENPFGEKGEGGCDHELSEEKAKELLDLLALDKKDEFAEATGGALMKQVTRFLKENDFKYTDTGGGCCGGHVGVPCTDDEMTRLIQKAHDRFSKAIERGLLMVKVSWFKPKLFKNLDDAEQWLHARGLI